MRRARRTPAICRPRRGAKHATDRDGYEAKPGRSETDRDGFAFFPSEAEHRRLAAVCARDPELHSGILRVFARHGHDAARDALRAAERDLGLLDSDLPRRPIDSIDFVQGAPWRLITPLWPVLLSSRGRKLVLVSLTLTTPSSVEARAHAGPLADGLDAEAGEGAILVIDCHEDGAEHLHGLGLVRDPAEMLDRWFSRTGATDATCRAKRVTGWRGHMRGEPSTLLGEVAKVLRYAFKPWPAAMGRRCLDTDVFASGTLAGPWAAALAPAAATSTTRRARTCARCGGALPPQARSDAIWCSGRCRNAAWRARGSSAAVHVPRGGEP